MPDFFTFFNYMLNGTLSVLREPLFTVALGDNVVSINFLGLGIACVALIVFWSFIIPKR